MNTHADQGQTATPAPSLGGAPPVLTAAQVTELLHLNTDYIRQLARDGGIPLTASRKAGGRFPRDEVAAWRRALSGP